MDQRSREPGQGANGRLAERLHRRGAYSTSRYRIDANGGIYRRAARRGEELINNWSRIDMLKNLRAVSVADVRQLSIRFARNVIRWPTSPGNVNVRHARLGKNCRRMRVIIRHVHEASLTCMRAVDSRRVRDDLMSSCVHRDASRCLATRSPVIDPCIYAVGKEVGFLSATFETRENGREENKFQSSTRKR